MPLPFQWVTKICHHSKSEWKVLFSWIWWCGFFVTLIKLMICWRKALLAGITVHACCSTPRRDSRFRLEHDFHNFHCVIRSLRLTSFSPGNCNSCWTVSIAIPRKSSVVLRPACFFGANDTQSSLQTVGYGDSGHIAQSQGDQELRRHISSDRSILLLPC